MREQLGPAQSAETVSHQCSGFCLCRSKVYTADLESALHYLLRVELATHHSLEGEELKVFKDFVILVTKVRSELLKLANVQGHIQVTSPSPR